MYLPFKARPPPTTSPSSTAVAKQAIRKFIQRTSNYHHLLVRLSPHRQVVVKLSKKTERSKQTVRKICVSRTQYLARVRLHDLDRRRGRR